MRKACRWSKKEQPTSSMSKLPWQALLEIVASQIPESGEVDRRAFAEASRSPHWFEV